MYKNNITGLAHIGLFISDIEKTKEFYQDILGFEVYHECQIEENGGVTKIAFIRNGDCVIEVVQPVGYTKRQDGFVDHIALNVKDIELVKEGLAKKGIEFESEEIVYAPMVFPPKGTKWILFRGPDGEHLEINQIL